MSGPKVVRIVTREEVEALCRQAIGGAEAAAEELRRMHERMGTWDDKAASDIHSSLEQLRSLLRAGQYLEVQKQAPLSATFMRSEAERLSREALTAAEILQKRRRHLLESAKSVILVLERQGIAVSAELRAVMSLAVAASSDDIQALRKIVSDGLKSARSEATGSAGISEKGRELAARLRDPSNGVSLEEWFNENRVPSAAEKRLDSALASVEVFCSPDEVREFRRRMEAILKAPAASIDPQVDSLVLEASTAAQRARKNALAATRLRELSSELRALGTSSALQFADDLLEAVQARQVERYEKMLERGQSVIRDELAAIAADARRRAVLAGLAALGYEVREGMTAAWVRDGRVIVRKVGTVDYGVELGAPQDASRLQVRLVGSDAPQMPRSSSRDRDQEVAWCSDFSELKEMLKKSGSEMTVERALDPGAELVKTVHFDIARGAEVDRQFGEKGQLRSST